MKYNAPEGCTGISVGGEQFNVDENGQIEVPDNGDYHSLLAPHGFKPVPAKAKTADEIAAELKALEDAEAEAKAKAEAEAAAKAATGENSGETKEVANTAAKPSTKKAAAKAATGE